jgi:HD-like signal output (HDOD) protein
MDPADLLHRTGYGQRVDWNGIAQQDEKRMAGAEFEHRIARRWNLPDHSIAGGAFGSVVERGRLR